MMKKVFPILIALVVIVSSCQTPAQKCEGTYNGQYTNNAIILTGINTTVTSSGDKTVNVTFNAGSGASVTVSSINVTEGSNSLALTKTEMFGAFSGAVNGNELNVGYSYIGGVISFVGTK